MKTVHFLGIGGSGASAAAAIAKSQGFEITGCDLNPYNEFTTQFKESQLFTGHNPNHLASQATPGNVDILAVTPAIFSLDPNNSELVIAKEKNIPILTWQQFVGKYLAKDKFVIAICGTHGKTTTTAMIAKILEDANLDPTVLLGANIPGWKTNYRAGKGKQHVLSGPVVSKVEPAEGYFVIEADEFNDNFLSYKPDISVVTNIEMDHPEYFKDFESYKKSFKKFLGQTKTKIIANLSDPGVQQTLPSHTKCGNSTLNYSKELISFPLQIPGKFNILNATAAFQVGRALGIKPAVIQKSLEKFTGVARRFEKVGNFKGADVYSDFGHHPTEIAKTMGAVREKFPDKKIILIYQPHMFSRTKALFDDFVKVFQNLDIDKIYIMDIYPSREIDTGLITSKQLVDAINKPSIFHIGGGTKILEKLKPEIKPGDIVFFMSAGDTDKLAKDLVKL